MVLVGNRYFPSGSYGHDLEESLFAIASDVSFDNSVNIENIFLIAACAWLGFFPVLQAEEKPSFALKDGDIVFTGSSAGQGAAITAATGSPITHCGVVFKKDGSWMVLEAVQPVRVTSLEIFMARAEKDAFAVRRPKAELEPEAYQKASKWAAAQIGLDYDVRFAWDDKKLYCSELVWKFYQQAGIELCAPRKFRDYDLQKPEVKKMIEQRYGSMDKLPMDEKVVAPSDLLASSLLMEVPKNEK